jgi:hypothetical protein
MKITFVRDGCAVTIESVDDSAVDLYKSIAWAPAKSEKAEEVTKKEIQKFIDDDVKDFKKKPYSSGNIQVGVKKQA